MNVWFLGDHKSVFGHHATVLMERAFYKLQLPVLKLETSFDYVKDGLFLKTAERKVTYDGIWQDLDIFTDTLLLCRSTYPEQLVNVIN